MPALVTAWPCWQEQRCDALWAEEGEAGAEGAAGAAGGGGGGSMGGLASVATYPSCSTVRSW